LKAAQLKPTKQVEIIMEGRAPAMAHARVWYKWQLSCSNQIMADQLRVTSKWLTRLVEWQTVGDCSCQLFVGLREVLPTLAQWAKVNVSNVTVKGASFGNWCRSVAEHSS